MVKKPKMEIDFFDMALMDSIDMGKRRALYKAGGKQKTIMQRMFKRRKKNSTAGNPPHHHAPGRSGLKYTWFSVDEYNATVIVGPKQYRDQERGTVGVLDRGGVTQIKIPVEINGRTITGTYRHTPATFRARPFVQPSLDAFVDNYPEMYRDVIR